MALPKLNLRDLFWLVLVVAMGCGWWLDRAAIKDRLTILETGLGAKFDRYISHEEAYKLLEEMSKLPSETPPAPMTREQRDRIRAILEGGATEEAATILAPEFRQPLE